MKLDLEWQKQREDLWCWAACLSIVLARVNPRSQCNIVNAFRSPHNCCPRPVSSPCGDGLEPQFIEAAWNAVHIASIRAEKDLDFKKIKRELDDCRPVMIGVGDPDAPFLTGSGHAVLVYGYTASKVLIHDPLDDNPFKLHEPDFSTVRKGYVWRWTWRRLPKVAISC